MTLPNFALPMRYSATDGPLIWPREFLCGPAYQRRQVCLTIAPAGVGKTSLLIAEAVHMAAGKKLFVKPTKPLRVWLFNGEESIDEIERRIAAVCKLHGIHVRDIEDTLFVNSGRDAPMELVTNEKPENGLINQRILKLADYLNDKVDVIIADPFISTHSVTENDNTAIDKVAKGWALLAERGNCAVHLVHHSRKTPPGQVVVDSGRGASSLLAAVRYARTLNQMTVEDGRKLQIQDIRSYVKINVGKENNSKTSENLWFKLESVCLDNDLTIDGVYYPSDEVGAVSAVLLKITDDNLTDDERNAVLLTAKGTYIAYNAQSQDWCGIEIARIIGLDKVKDKSKIKSIIERALGEKIIEKYYDSKSGKK